jgi:hypothetical protein
MRDDEGFSWRAIATEVGMSPTGVRKRYSGVSSPDGSTVL